jgi:hypothetical protein
MFSTSMAGLLSGLACTFSLVPSTAFSQVQALVQTGDSLPGFGLVTAVGEFATNANGDWVATVTTDQFANNAALILRNHQVLTYPGDPGMGGVTPVFSTIQIGLDIDALGNVAWLARNPALTNAPLVAFVNTIPYVTEGQFQVIPGLTAAAQWSGLRAAKLDPSGSGTLYLTLALAGPGLGGESGPALVEVGPDGQGGLDFAVLGNSVDDFPGPQNWIGFISELPRTRERMATNVVDQLVIPAGVFDSGIFEKPAGSATFQAIALEGDSAPALGASWTGFLGSSVALNNSGGLAFTGSATDALGSFDLLVLNGISVARTGASLPGIAPFELVQICNNTPGSSAPLALSQNDAVLWLGRWNDPDQSRDQGLFLGQKLVVQEGVSRVDGIAIAALTPTGPSGSSLYTLAADGSAVYFRANLADGKAGFYRAEVDSSVTSLPGCLPKAAALASADPVPGVAAAYVLTQPQTPDAIGLALLSLDATNGCGLVLPGVGELLVDIGSGLFGLPVGVTTQPGTSVIPGPTTPSAVAFFGLTYYAQGVWVSPTAAVETYRLSNALAISFGF